MKHHFHKLLAVATLFILATQAVQAKRIQIPRMYMFGFAASFNDTIVHFTDILPVDTPWIEKSNGFLLGRQQYSTQLRNHLLQKNMPYRTCVVFYDKNRSKIEKEYLKLKRQYTQQKDGQNHFDVRFISTTDFSFKSVSMSQAAVEETRETSTTKDPAGQQQEGRKKGKKKRGK